MIGDALAVQSWRILLRRRKDKKEGKKEHTRLLIIRWN